MKSTNASIGQTQDHSIVPFPPFSFFHGLGEEYFLQFDEVELEENAGDQGGTGLI